MDWDQELKKIAKNDANANPLQELVNQESTFKPPNVDDVIKQADATVLSKSKKKKVRQCTLCCDYYRLGAGRCRIPKSTEWIEVDADGPN